MGPIQYKLNLIKEGVSLSTLDESSPDFDVMNSIRLSLYETLVDIGGPHLLVEADGSMTNRLLVALKALVEKITAFFKNLSSKLKGHVDPRTAFVKKHLSVLKAYKPAGLMNNANVQVLSIPQKLDNPVPFDKFQDTVKKALQYCDELVSDKHPKYPFKTMMGHEERHTDGHIASDMASEIFGGYANDHSVMTDVYGTSRGFKVNALPNVPKLADLFLTDYTKGLDAIESIASVIHGSIERAFRASSQHSRDTPPQDASVDTKTAHRDRGSALHGVVSAYNAILRLIHSFIATVMYGYNMIYKVLQAAVAHTHDTASASKG